MNRLVLIDGNAILHRAYHALPPLTAPDGTIVNAVYGFISILLKLFSDLKPTHIAVAFDRAAPTFRKKLFKEYQAQRPKMEDNLVGQVDIVHEVITAFGIPIYEIDGFEADDVIGTIAVHVIPGLTRDPSSFSKNGFRLGGRNDKGIDQVIIVSGDRDLLQLVRDEKIFCFMPTKGLSEGKLYGEKEVIERMGVSPAQIPDFKALAGDASDNYPGVPGVGPKTAIELIAKHGTIENLYKNLKNNTLKATLVAKLKAGEASARMSYELATIRADAPITIELNEARLSTLDTPEVRKMLEDFHFSSLIKRLNGEKSMAEQNKQVKKNQKIKIASDQQQLF